MISPYVYGTLLLAVLLASRKCAGQLEPTQSLHLLAANGNLTELKAAISELQSMNASAVVSE